MKKFFLFVALIILPMVVQAQPVRPTTNPNTQALVRIQELEQEIRTLTGQVERAQLTAEDLKKKLDLLQRDIEFRLNRLESQTPNAAASVPPAVSAPVEPAAIQPSAPVVAPVSELKVPQVDGYQPSVAAPAGNFLSFNTPAEHYEFALAQIRQAKYAEAEQALQSFIVQYPRHELVANAFYWIGETYYVRAQYTEAARYFLESYQKFPRANKAPDSLLKLGLALANLDKKDEACLTLNRVTTEYPRAGDLIKRRARDEASKLACPAKP